MICGSMNTVCPEPEASWTMPLISFWKEDFTGNT